MLPQQSKVCSRKANDAGMGRAPGTALAYMYWCKGFQLMDAHKHLTGLRACNPKLTAIRAATCDMLFDGSGRVPVRISLPRSKAGYAKHVQVGSCIYRILEPERFQCRHNCYSTS